MEASPTPPPSTVRVTTSDGSSFIADHDHALGAIVFLLVRLYVEAQVVELGRDRLGISCKRDISDYFGLPSGQAGSDGRWSYTFEPNTRDASSCLHAITQVVHALCVMNRGICSTDVARQVGEAAQATGLPIRDEPTDRAWHVRHGLVHPI
jgi:hypothetical protein